MSNKEKKPYFVSNPNLQFPEDNVEGNFCNTCGEKKEVIYKLGFGTEVKEECPNKCNNKIERGW